MELARIERDVSDELQKFLIMKGEVALADDLYQQQVVTFAAADQDGIYVLDNKLPLLLVEPFEDYLSRNWPSVAEYVDFFNGEE